METELPMSDEIYDVPPWRPNNLHFGVLIQFTEVDGRAYSSSCGAELRPGEPLDKLVKRVEREAMARVIELGFPHEKHKQPASTGLG